MAPSYEFSLRALKSRIMADSDFLWITVGPRRSSKMARRASRTRLVSCSSAISLRVGSMYSCRCLWSNALISSNVGRCSRPSHVVSFSAQNKNRKSAKARRGAPAHCTAPCVCGNSCTWGRCTFPSYFETSQLLFPLLPGFLPHTGHLARLLGVYCAGAPRRLRTFHQGVLFRQLSEIGRAH